MGIWVHVWMIPCLNDNKNYFVSYANSQFFISKNGLMKYFSWDPDKDYIRNDICESLNYIYLSPSP